jgi:hypothetical protein
MKPKQIIASVLFLFAAGLLVWWFVSGHQMWTTTQHMVELKDELFGTVTQAWETQFTPGLELIGSMVVVFGGVGWFLLRSASRQKVT